MTCMNCMKYLGGDFVGLPSRTTQWKVVCWHAFPRMYVKSNRLIIECRCVLKVGNVHMR